MKEIISQKLARRVILNSLLLDGRTKLKKGGAGVREAVEHLGYVQIDTISVIERAHHHTLWTRLPGYEPRYLHEAGRLRARQPRVRFLSPFDNLAINRLRLKERFGFDYAFECYVPKHKRNHGYFVLPILFGEEIVGRLDPKADRSNRTLIIRRLSIEPGFSDLDRLVPELNRALCALASFNGCEKIRLENVQPRELAARLKKTKPGA